MASSQVLEYLGISRPALKSLVDRGKLIPLVEKNATRLFYRSDVEERKKKLRNIKRSFVHRNRCVKAPDSQRRVLSFFLEPVGIILYVHSQTYEIDYFSNSEFDLDKIKKAADLLDSLTIQLDGFFNTKKELEQ